MPRAKRTKPRKAEATPKQLEIDLKHYEALKLRLKGHSFYEIAEMLDYETSAAARKAVLSAVKKIGWEPAVEAVKIHLQRLDLMIEKLWPQVERGSVNATLAVERLMKRQAALVPGMNAPATVAVTDPTGKHAGPLIILPPVDGTLPPAVEEQLKHISRKAEDDGTEDQDDDDGTTEADEE